MEKYSKNNVIKVYCTRCNLVFESRVKFEKHLEKHTSNIPCDVCPIDTVLLKFASLFKRKSTRNLE